MKHLAVEYKKFSSQRRFGVELEVGSTISKVKVQAAIRSITDRPVVVTKYQPSTENRFWHVKNDATCGPLGRSGPKGVEIASFVGKGISDLQHIAEVADKLTEIGCKVNNNCGLHVHADACDLSKSQVGNILAHWIKIENCLQYSLPVRRRENEYCKMVNSRILLPKYLPLLTSAENFYCLLSPADIGYYENQDRRVTLNIVNYARACTYGTNIRKTLELRWPEGTLSSTDVKCWTRLFLHFIDTCKDRPFPANFNVCNLSEMLKYLGLGHESHSFTIFSEGLFETKTWLLQRFIEYSKEYKQEATDILDFMWSPARKYA